MELPFTIVFEPPSHAELRALLRLRGYWVAGSIVALAIGTAYLLANVAHANAVGAETGVSFALTSQPSGAAVWIDGHPRGTTPLQLSVAPGAHSVALKSAHALDSQYSVDVGFDGSRLDAVLWRRQPSVTRLRPALPGAELSDVRVLADGQLGLSIALPPGRQMQGWRLDPHSGALAFVLGDISGARLTFAPDGRILAYLGSAIGPWPGRSSESNATGGLPLTTLWLADTSAGENAPIVGWAAPLDPVEQLTDVSWSPRGDRLLALAGRALQGGAGQTRGWFVDTAGLVAQLTLSIPSDVVPGTEAWSPDGEHVAFVAHTAQVNALCLLGVDGSFRYVADLDPSNTGPPGYPPFSWSADGQRIVFVAPYQHLPGVAFNWLHPEAQHALYVASLDDPTPNAIADTLASQATWREDGQLLGLWRAGSDSALSIRLLNGSGGSGQGLLDLPFKPDGEYAAVWDLDRADLLIANRTSSGNSSTEYWLARLGLDGDR